MQLTMPAWHKVLGRLQQTRKPDHEPNDNQAMLGVAQAKCAPIRAKQGLARDRRVRWSQDEARWGTGQGSRMKPIHPSDRPTICSETPPFAEFYRASAPVTSPKG